MSDLPDSPARRASPPQTDRAREKHDVRRQQIIDAAMRLFNEKPYENVSIRDLETESGLTRGPIYYYFANKEEIYGEVVREGLRRILARIETAIASRTTPKAQMSAVIDTYLDEYDDARNTFDVQVRFFFGMRPSVNFSAELLEDVNTLVRACVKCVTDVIKAGEKAGVFAARDPEFQAMAMWGVMSTVVQMTDDNARMRAVGRPAAQLRKNIRAYILAALGARA